MSWGRFGDDSERPETGTATFLETHKNNSLTRVSARAPSGVHWREIGGCAIRIELLLIGDVKN